MQWFDPEYWRQHGEIEAVAAGRGRAWFVHRQQEHYVLRHYRRGGFAAKITADNYFWNGLEKTRAWREYRLLETMQSLGLPVPYPLAARVLRRGILYRADLLTRCIPDSQSLSRVLVEQALDDQRWFDIGTCIRDFHRHHIYHADLNAHNILLDAQGKIYLIDFDKSGIVHYGSWKPQTLQRLHRSLNKLQAQHKHYFFADKNWQALMAGYQSQ